MEFLKLPGSKENFTIQRYFDTVSVQDREIIGRPCSIRLFENLLARNKTLELKVSEYSIRKVVNNDLGMRSYKRKRIHFRNEQVKKKRVFRCKGEPGWHASRGLDNVLFSNEKGFLRSL